jgi:hypothetical protein
MSMCSHFVCSGARCASWQHLTNSATADPCVTATVNMVGVCGTFVTKVQNDAKFLSAANDEQIKGAAAQGVQPSVQ